MIPLEGNSYLKISKMGKIALVIGATGLIGRNLVFELLKNPNYTQVIVLVRRDMVIKHEKFTQIMLDFSQLNNYEDKMVAYHVFCCMGSTSAKTPDKENYRRIDFDIPLQIAEITFRNGAQSFLLVSSMGANLQSSIFYSRLKAELEVAIEKIGFKTVFVLRPSLLLGNRLESRPLETITQYLMRVMNPIFIGPLKLYKAIKGETVAKALMHAALSEKIGNNLVLNNEIFELADAAK
jgi:uncharacterized protein YbjT (DUF2867 family)